MNKSSLQNYRSLLLEIDLLEEERARLLSSLLMPHQLSSAPVQKGRYSDPVGETASKLTNIRTMIDKKLDKLIDKRAALEKKSGKFISQAKNLLTMRYLLGYTWEEIADKMHYSY